MVSALLRRVGAAAAAGAIVVSCRGPTRAAPETSLPGVSNTSLRAPVEFSFESIDERPVSSAATRGSPAVVAFITTSSLSCQAQIDFLVAMAKNDGNRVHYAAVALDGRDARELVDLYRKALSVPFPMAVADAKAMAGTSAFGDVSAVPVTVVLDPTGRVAWRADGRVVKSEELRRELKGL